jgi:glycosyltransferase involved in cell wall biosynthesis
MHIVFLSHEYPLWSPGGAGTFLQTFGRTLTANGHRVKVLGVGKSDVEEQMEDEGVQLIRLKKNNSRVPNFMYNALVINKRLKEIHQESKIDIIESAELGLGIISRKHPAKKVIRLHGGHHFFAEAEKRGIDWRKGLLEKRSFNKADGFIAVSEYVKSHTAKYLSFHGKPVTVINYPIDTDLNQPEVTVNKDRILFAGTVCEKKGVRELIEAFKIVRDRFPEKHLDIYGRDWFFPDGRSYIEMLRNTYDDSYLKNITFHGSIPREELNKKYAEAVFCVFPSHMETQGLVTLEAMLLKKTVIFSEYGPGPETIDHGRTGFLCDVYKPEDIAEKMLWCLEHPDALEKIGETAREQVLDKYHKNTILEKNLAFYQSLLS